MTPTKFLIGQFVLTLVLILISIWGAAQWTAAELGHQPRLGEAWFWINDYPVYFPWRFFQWWYAYDAYAPQVFARGGVIASLGGLAGIFMAVVASINRARQDKASTTYGSARWLANLISGIAASSTMTDWSSASLAGAIFVIQEPPTFLPLPRLGPARGSGW